MYTKPSLSYVGLALIPVIMSSIAVLLSGIGTGFNKWSSCAIIFASALFVVFIIINPLYLVFLAKLFVLKHNVSYLLSVIVTGVFGIGSVIILNAERWKKNNVGWDFNSEIVFTIELVIVGIILVIGLAIVACSKSSS